MIVIQPNRLAQLRLFCFPYAGGGALSFRTWVNHLSAKIEVCAIELPGRGTQMKSPPFVRLEPLIEAIATNILPHLDKPFAFFGHSMGAIVSFELSRFLRRYKLEPIHLFASGRRAPQICSAEPFIHTLPESEFLDKLRHLNGTPEAVLANAELMQLLSPILRADFAVIETYIYAEESPLNCPITAFGGLKDPEVSFTELEAWQQQTNATFSIQMLPGDYFFLHSAENLLLNSISKSLQLGNS